MVTERIPTEARITDKKKTREIFKKTSKNEDFSLSSNKIIPSKLNAPIIR